MNYFHIDWKKGLEMIRHKASAEIAAMLIVSIFCCFVAERYQRTAPDTISIISGQTVPEEKSTADIAALPAVSHEITNAANSEDDTAAVNNISGTEQTVPLESPEAEKSVPEKETGEKSNVEETIAEETAAEESSAAPKEPLTAAELMAQAPPSPSRLNMAYEFASDIPGEPEDSYAGTAYHRLINRDEDWIYQIYGNRAVAPGILAVNLGITGKNIGNYSDWTNVGLLFYDGDGNMIQGYSNARDILAMASVYSYFHPFDNIDEFYQYAEQLWKNSHKYSLSVSDVYFCEGECKYTDFHINEDESGSNTPLDSQTSATGIASPAVAEAAPDPADQTSAPTGTDPADQTSASTATVSSQQSSSAGNIMDETKCRGHVDLIIRATIIGLDESNKNLFKLDTQGSSDKNYTDTWKGWSMLRKRYVSDLLKQDWFDLYGLTIPAGMHIQNPLTAAEIQYYMNMMPEDTSEERRTLVKLALQSVGSIPYYMGGKPSGPGYEANGFGNPVAPDINGRSLRGLDCSGWISWLYWTALERHLPYESTDGLCALGRQIDRSELKPGDYIVRTGDDAHVCLFLAWAPDGTMYVIHERGSSCNNVIVSNSDLHWPYYRNLLD